MRAFAEYVMRSRTQALFVIVLSVATVLFYWIGAAALALVILRQSQKEAFIIWLWAMLPALGVAWFGEVAPAVVLTTMFVSASVLKATANWAFALVMVVIISGFGMSVVLITEPTWLAALEEQLQTMFVQLNQQMSDPEVVLEPPTRNQILSMLSLFSAVIATLCLMAGRALHAAIDNPGGFRKEYFAMRLPPVLASVLVIIAIVILMQDSKNIAWSYLVALPLLVAGLGFVHQQLASKGKSKLLIKFVYGFVVLVSPVKEIVIVLGFLDSWMNLRQKIAKTSKN